MAAPGHHLPGPGRPAPASTYRVQLRDSFPFAAAGDVVDYLDALGVDWLYCSPILTATPGSAHGYDVVDHSTVSAELGGTGGLRELAARLADRGMHAVADVVPNHMAVPVPESANRQLADVLMHGRDSAYASWFDIDWDSPDNPGQLLMPVLGDSIGAVIAAGDLRLDTGGPAPVLRYFDHAFPLAPGTEGLGQDLPALLAAQHYRLAHWRVAADELNYRRFFDVTSLIGVRVEVPEVFTATHAVLLRLVADGTLAGLRIDHPDGLADPGGYLARLAEQSGGAWIVAEKIVEREEELPADWRCAGTTGYDALQMVLGLFVDAAGEGPLTGLYNALSAESTGYGEVVEETKHRVLTDVLSAEVNRLARLALWIGRLDPMLRDTSARAWREALVEMLAAVAVYRAYVTPGEPADATAGALLTGAAELATGRLSTRETEIALVRDLALGSGMAGTGGRERELRAEFVTRFQQTTGPVMAKGVEDTAFYRYFRLLALDEVGGDPGDLGSAVEGFHAGCTRLQRDWPLTMTTLSTHDTKRSEDVRARLAVLSEIPAAWGDAVMQWRAASRPYRAQSRWPDGNTEYLFWQTLVGAWPLPADRLLAYLSKATREAKQHTSWTEPDTAYDESVVAFTTAVLGDQALMAQVEEFVTGRLIGPGRVTALAQKLLQLTMPGVPDVYQGTELWDLSLVDPDNRRPVDYDGRRRLLAALPERGGVPVDDSGAAKLLVVSRALRLRRKHPEWFGADATYQPLAATGPAAEHLVGFVRSGSVVTLAPRLVVGLERRGWQDTTVPLPPGRWRDVLTGAEVDGGERLAAELLLAFPVALLVRTG